MRRWPLIALRAPRQLVGLDRKAAAVRTETDRWWRGATTAGRYPDSEAASHGLARARDQFLRVQLVHGLCLMMGQLAYDQVTRLCATAGRDDLVLDLVVSGDGAEESHMVDDLWQVAQGDRTLDAFVGDHGFHGPDEGALHSHSWREDGRPLVGLVERYEHQGAARAATSSARRAEAAAELIGELSPVRRRFAAGVLAMAERAIPRRETTKAAFLQAIDGARAAARSLGGHLHSAGHIEDPEDVFHLTIAEATGSADALPLDVIASRKATRDRYLDVDVPKSFVGRPEPTVCAGRAVEGAVDDFELRGVGAASGRAEGRARVVTSADQVGALEPGEILVCVSTDPAWVPFFEIAAAAVVEIGGPMSHAAIVAREMGLPCVVGVDAATTHIAPGDHLHVDGGAGIITVKRVRA